MAARALPGRDNFVANGPSAVNGQRSTVNGQRTTNYRTSITFCT
jgi:hypothetical protein